MPKIKLAGGWCRTRPVQEIPVVDGFAKCQTLQNYVVRNHRLRKIGGTHRLTKQAITNRISWVTRSYHILGDGSQVKRALCFCNGVLYSIDPVAGTLSQIQTGFTHDCVPLDMTMQVADVSTLFIFFGDRHPLKYDGNGAYECYDTSLNAGIISGTPYLDRAFYIVKNSSEMYYSETLAPETIEDSIISGNDRNSVNLAAVVGGDETLYIFKNNAIYQLFGRTPTTFQLRLVSEKYGLMNKRSWCKVGAGIVFQNSFDKELYYFGGSEASIQPLTEEDIRLREIINNTDDSLNSTTMCVHDGLFRFSFQHRESTIDMNNCELVYCIHEPSAGSLPKWSLIKGSNVFSYSIWDRLGDSNELVTGRSDKGLLMYHNRGFDFDENAIETIVRTGEYNLSEDMICSLDSIFIEAKPGSYHNNSIFRYYMDARYSDRGENYLSMAGETRTVGQLHLSKQSMFKKRIPVLAGKDTGSSVSFEVYDNQNDTEMELHSITYNATPLYIMT